MGHRFLNFNLDSKLKLDIFRKSVLQLHNKLHHHSRRNHQVQLQQYLLITSFSSTSTMYFNYITSQIIILGFIIKCSFSSTIPIILNLPIHYLLLRKYLNIYNLYIYNYHTFTQLYLQGHFFRTNIGILLLSPTLGASRIKNPCLRKSS